MNNLFISVTDPDLPQQMLHDVVHTGIVNAAVIKRDEHCALLWTCACSSCFRMPHWRSGGSAQGLVRLVDCNVLLHCLYYLCLLSTLRDAAACQCKPATFWDWYAPMVACGHGKSQPVTSSRYHSMSCRCFNTTQLHSTHQRSNVRIKQCAVISRDLCFTTGRLDLQICCPYYLVNLARTSAHHE